MVTTITPAVSHDCEGHPHFLRRSRHHVDCGVHHCDLHFPLQLSLFTFAITDPNVNVTITITSSSGLGTPIVRGPALYATLRLHRSELSRVECHQQRHI